LHVLSQALLDYAAECMSRTRSLLTMTVTASEIEIKSTDRLMELSTSSEFHVSVELTENRWML